MTPCPTYPGYSVEGESVCTHRRRFGLGRGRGGGVRIDPSYVKWLGTWTGHGGYLFVSVSTVSGQRSIPVHVMIADAHHGPCPPGLEVRHLDGICLNNSPGNLEYGTPRENAEDRMRCGAHMRGEENPRARLSSGQVAEIRRRADTGETLRGLAQVFAVGATTIRDIVSGKTWRVTP